MITQSVPTTNPVFLTAEWRKLLMANYKIDSAILKQFLPAHTELDFYNDNCYVSLVGFEFDKVKLKGVSIPLHTRFPEVNLRFYVKRKDGNAWKRGVVFISEIVPKPTIAWIANAFYKEKYEVALMRRELSQTENEISIAYKWKKKNMWNKISVVAENHPVLIKDNTEEAFIYEHYFGYAKSGQDKTNEYEVQHFSWDAYPVKQYSIDCDFAQQYGGGFSFLNHGEPVSVFLAEGSAVTILKKRQFGPVASVPSLPSSGRPRFHGQHGPLSVI